MKPVVYYAVAAMPFATPGRAAIAELLAIGPGEYFSVRDPMQYQHWVRSCNNAYRKERVG